MTIVALVPAFNSERSVGRTVESLLDFVDEVVVVDDGSADRTAAAAVDAGAFVVQLPANRGKTGAVIAGVEARPRADFYLLADADLGTTAARLRTLLGPVLSGAADMTIGALPSAGRRGGFGLARSLSAWGIERATGWRPRAPLSGQRAIKGAFLRAVLAMSIPAERFGLESALSIDAIRNGARVLEVDVDVDHHHRGRTLGGFAHRGRQAADIARALWPRLTTRAFRVGTMVVAFVAAVVLAHLAARSSEPGSRPLLEPRSSRAPVLIVGMPGVRFSDLREMPNLSALAREGAVGAMTVRTRTGFPSSVEGYATLGAGSRVDAEAPAGQAFNAGEPLEGGAARDALARRAGTRSKGEVVVVGAPSAARQAGERVGSLPGALGDAVHAAGMTTAVVGNADRSRPRLIDDPQLGPVSPEEPEEPDVSRPAAVALMDSSGTVDFGRVDSGLLVADPDAPFGLRSDPEETIAAVAEAVGRGADLVIVDPGDLDRARSFARLATEAQTETHRAKALGSVDRLIPRLRAAVGPRATLLVIGVTPPAPDWHLTPVVAAGPSVPRGTLLHSPSTRRPGVVTLTDIAPSALSVLGVERPGGMIGGALRQADAGGDTSAHLSRLEEVDRTAAYRERIYLGSTMGYIGFQALLYLLAVWVFTRLGPRGGAAGALRLGVLAVAAHPMATFLHRWIPGVEDSGWWGVVGLLALDLLLGAAALALGRRRGVAPLGWIAAGTIVVLASDVAGGAGLQMSSLLGYSFHSAGRFTGFGNQAFAVLAATTVLAAAIHVHHAPRRGEALVAVGLLFAFVTILDGSPALGSDVGGILTMVPVFGLTWLALAGRRLSWRTILIAGGVTLLALTAAAAVDVARPAETQTHLGRLAEDVLARGPEPLLETVGRKAAANLRTWGSPWVWGLAVLAISLLTVLIVDRNWHRILPPGTALRAGVAGTVAAGVLGYAVNDSGVVVAALVLVYLGPLLSLVALDREAEPVELSKKAVAESHLKLAT